MTILTLYVNLADGDFVHFTEVVTISSTTEERPCFNIQTLNDNAVEDIELFDVILSDENGITVTGGRRRRIVFQDDGDRKFYWPHDAFLSCMHILPMSIGINVLRYQIIITTVEIEVAFNITTLSVTEGNLLSVCVRVVNGSVGITNGVAVGVTATDITTTSGGMVTSITWHTRQHSLT